MKWWIIIGLALLLAGYAPQLRTHYTPLPVAVRRWQGAIILPRLAVRLEIVKLT